jgi:Lrp/AsnC family leucine-responsive transcriptional regulator
MTSAQFLCRCSSTPDPSQPDDATDRLSGLTPIESCYSVAGEDFNVLMVRVESPAGLERLLQEICKAANVTTRTTVVLSTSFEGRAPS